ncbi:MAG: histidinol-phosphatase HisJ family protein [Clostridia bacterium]|nr:histidinol-phosphatase HisJ family protein [Clostridia bacterium]
MAFKNIVDLHTHTDNSFDGNHSTMYLCETAYMKGIRAIAFTDHLEMDAFYRDNFNRTAIQSFFEVAKARSAFSGKLLVCVGAELGQAVYDKEISEKLLNTMKYDFVIGSIHNLPNIQDFYYMDFSNESIDYMDLLSQYFDWELKLAQWDKFDTLAHLTYPLRYIVGKYGKNVDMAKFGEIIDEILLTLIKNKKSLELNTAGLRQPIGITSPDESILKRYKELGGKLLTIGSDAHYAEHLGAGIEQGYELALKCGFDKIALYQDRTPTLIPIE